MVMAIIGYDMEAIASQNIYLIVSIIQKPPFFSFLFLNLKFCMFCFSSLHMAPSGTTLSHPLNNARFSVAPVLTRYSFFIKKRSPFQLKSYSGIPAAKLYEKVHDGHLKKINGGELMDAATAKQKAYIKGLFVQGGLPGWIFSPLYR